ncbi:IS982 family transposase [Parapusillimonas sp. SGNA-6]|uniref:IS982 family transposase n=1 Tax=Parapedobacter sp. SGR-10 TaxID=2710879 RepID=UPI0013D13BEE|nr:IS982 family transposase [Parapedobacter sp. SGR-10]NGF58362.1 IS982 family transposase [Parapedobacter sp. SGR-10]NGM89278.1 IS982 family transposase [Parapusillimonas sp. SGNA-6]
MNNFKANYERILEVLRKISTDQQLPVQRRRPRMSDLEVISLSLTAEYMGIDSENNLFRILPPFFKTRIERTVFNRRKRRLMSYQNAIRMKLAASFNEFEDVFVVDSMPLEICRLARSSRSKICKEELYSMPSKGYCASQKMYYYGYKLHAVCSLKGVFQAIDLTPANVHDIHYLNDIKYQLSDCTLLGDKGYLSSDIQLNLFESSNIRLDTPKRTNQKEYEPQFSLYRKSRKRIETLFSQMCDQFMVRRNYAKSFDGFKTRILTKITAMTIIQYINKNIFNRNINNLKISII